MRCFRHVQLGGVPQKSWRRLLEREKSGHFVFYIAYCCTSVCNMGTLLSSLMHVCVFVNYIWQSILTEIITVMMYKHEIWISCWNYITEKIELCSQTLSPPACFYAECVLYSKKRERAHMNLINSFFFYWTEASLCSSWDRLQFHPMTLIWTSGRRQSCVY